MSDPAASTDAADAAEAASGSAFVPGEKPGAAGKAALTPVEGLLRQVEYYFSDGNFDRDKFLQEEVAKVSSAPPSPQRRKRTAEDEYLDSWEAEVAQDAAQSAAAPTSLLGGSAARRHTAASGAGSASGPQAGSARLAAAFRG